MHALVAVGLLLLVVVTALLLAEVAGALRATRAARAARGGAPPPPPPPPHPLMKAIVDVMSGLDKTALKVHDMVDKAGHALKGFTALSAPPARGGGAAAGDRSRPRAAAARRPWTSYATWEELEADGDALVQYSIQRTAAIDNPALDWGPVMRELAPRLLENREYIGIVNLGPDGHTLRVEAMEASPLEAGASDSETSFASVPLELVKKYICRPALFTFHTHPANPRGCPLPSSQDLQVAIHLGALGYYAASVVVSRYGVFAYGPDWSSYRAINEAKDPVLARLNFIHDVVAAHEAIRSWAPYRLQDYFDFYRRHRMYIIVYPLPALVGDMRRVTTTWNLEAPVDYDFVESCRQDIDDRVSGRVQKWGVADLRLSYK